jgi:hypothetical protein
MDSHAGDSDDNALPIWELSSSDGWDQISCRARGVVLGDADVFVRVHFCIEGSFWDKLETVKSGLERAKLVPDFGVSLPQVITTLAQLTELRDALGNWLRVPQELTVSLGCEDSAVTVTLRPRDDVVSSIDRPVCEFTYRVSRLRVALQFVCDQSCIRLMHSGLHTWLGAFRPKPDC